MTKLLVAAAILGSALAGCSSDLGATDAAGNCVVLPNLSVRSDADMSKLPTTCFGVQGTFELSGTSLGDLDAISGLVVATHLRIENNGDLASFAGLDNVQVLGDLIIAGNPALQTIDGLEATVSVNRLEVTDNPALRDVRGLSNVGEVRGDAIIEGNDGLRDLRGLSRLQAVGAALSIRDNGGLTSLAGLDRLSAVRGLVIEANPAMTSLTGAESLQVVVDLQIASNPRLTSTTGMKLIEVGNLTVSDNPLMGHLGGFDKLTRARGSVTIENNASLIDVDGFSTAFLAVSGILAVRGNAVLTQATGLGNVKAVGAGIIVTGNSRLSQCRASAIRSRIPSVSGGVEIRNNSASYNPC